MVVDDNPRVLRSVERLLQRGGFCSRSFQTYGAAADAIRDFKSPPVLSMIDLVLDHGRLGTELAAEIRTRFGHSPIIAILSGYQVDNEATSNADTYLEKPLGLRATSDLLMRAVLAHVRLHPALNSSVLELATIHGLSPQEAKILGSLVSGTSRAKLASVIGLSPNTVKSQIRQILSKTGSASLSDVLSNVLDVTHRHSTS